MTTISTFFGLQTSLRGLIAQQQAIDVTGHNIANANTPGYSRQEAVLEPTQPFNVPANSALTGAGAQLGSGVDVASIRRIRDQFLDLQYRAQNMSLGDTSTRADSLDQVELAFGEPSDNGLNAQLAKFWSAWSDVANAPENAGARTALVTNAQTLTSTFKTISDQLTTVAQQAQTQYNGITGPSGDVAAAAKELAGLNTSIKDAVFRGQQPNDLEDRRDQLLDQLSGLAQTSVTDLGDGSLKVDFGGVTLVDPSAAGGYTWPQTLSATPGGKLGALADLASPTGQPLSYLSQLDGVAADLVAKVNALHTATPFFSTTGTTAATIGVVATAATVQAGSTGATGANDVAQAIAALRGGSTDQAYGALVAQVGTQVQANARAQTTAQSLVSAVDDRRQSVAGVSLDEEMTNLMRFQRGYQASARAMTTMDDMLDTLISRTGKVGL
jgi:flagellar hook-associated protein 1 FlgK